jgi:hypothetical protein
MINHVVLLQPKAETTTEQIAVALRNVEALKEAIPGIVSVATGKNMSANHRGYTSGFVMRFADEESFRAYAPHPAHQPVSQELQAICESIIDFDLVD